MAKETYDSKKRGMTPYKKWLRQHDEIIRKEYASRPTEDMAQEYGINYYTLSRRAKRLGVGKSETLMHASWKKGGWKEGRGKTKRSEEKEAYMKVHFSDTRNEDLARYFGVDVKTVRRWARRLGLEKSEAFMKHARGSGNKKYYTPEYEEWRSRRIAEVYPDADGEALKALAEELGLSMSGLKSEASMAGVKRSEERVRESRRMGIGKRKIFTEELINAIGEYYPTHTNQEVAEHFGINIGSLNQIAVRYGMKKTTEHKSMVRRQVWEKNRSGDAGEKCGQPHGHPHTV
jgi:transposase